ncbi:uncharacterized protein LOC126883533 [Diabrotica virgifera virgifera]|uniref:Uncharacterized protein n=1 Tax=Diabrotica virgifera virgifera TaxID=50390 RepID=A0ABM5K4L5_DIAVI|nr:uncharacterized protein LOC126883533 [Diabrotica virgifera virgifera]
MSPEEEKEEKRLTKETEAWDSSKEEMSPEEEEIRIEKEGERDTIETVVFEEEVCEKEEAEYTINMCKESEEKGRKLICGKEKEKELRVKLREYENLINEENKVAKKYEHSFEVKDVGNFRSKTYPIPYKYRHWDKGSNCFSGGNKYFDIKENCCCREKIILFVALIENDFISKQGGVVIVYQSINQR